MGLIRTGSACLPSQLSVMGHGQCQSVSVVFTGSSAIAIFLYCLYWAMGNSSLLSLLGHRQCQSVSGVFTGSSAIAIFLYCLYWAMGNASRSLLSLLGHGQCQSIVFTGPWEIAVYAVCLCCLYWSMGNSTVSLCCLYWAMGNSTLSVSVVFTGPWAIAPCQSLLSFLGHEQCRCVSPCCLYSGTTRVSVFSNCLATQNPTELFSTYLSLVNSRWRNTIYPHIYTPD